MYNRLVKPHGRASQKQINVLVKNHTRVAEALAQAHKMQKSTEKKVLLHIIVEPHVRAALQTFLKNHKKLLKYRWLNHRRVAEAFA